MKPFSVEVGGVDAFASMAVHPEFPAVSYVYELARRRTQEMDNNIHPQEALGRPQLLSTNGGS